MNEDSNRIGRILKSYRIKKKYTLDKISNKTKISIQNLQNIEEGAFHLIGGKFYQKSLQIIEYLQVLVSSAYEIRCYSLFRELWKQVRSPVWHAGP